METISRKKLIEYYCEKCNFRTQSLFNFNKHKTTQKHNRESSPNNLSTINRKETYSCETCNFFTANLFDYNKHNSTKRHMNKVAMGNNPIFK